MDILDKKVKIGFLKIDGIDVLIILTFTIVVVLIFFSILFQYFQHRFRLFRFSEALDYQLKFLPDSIFYNFKELKNKNTKIVKPTAKKTPIEPVENQTQSAKIYECEICTSKILINDKRLS